VFKVGGLVCVLLVLAACGAPQSQPAAPHADVTAGASNAAPGEPAPAEPAPGPGVFRIDASRSSLRLLVYRAGTMARLGHNHVISHQGLEGWVKYSGHLNDASFALNIPVAAFVVDDAALRGEQGPDFAAPVPDDAKAGTLRNMLSESLLDAQRFPVVTLSSTELTASGASVTATLAVMVAGHASVLHVPFVLDARGSELRATGSVAMRQSALGLVPFSIMLGALQVQDEFTVSFELTAVASI
jgi:hypothetical protein